MKNNKARSFIAIMVVIAILSLLLRVSIEKIIKINIAQNESNAQATLKLIATALDNYAKDHLGSYPVNLSILIQNNPPYLDKDYTAGSPLKGYLYNCSRIDVSGYSCSGRPVKCDFTGKKIYTVTTGGLLIEECSKKE